MAWRTAVWLLSIPAIVAELLLCARLLKTGLFRSYPRFFAFVAWLAIESIALSMLFQWGRSWYGYVWSVTRAVAMVLEAMAVLEIFGRWASSFPGIGTFGRNLLAVLVILSIWVSVATIPISQSSAGWLRLYQGISLSNRAVNLCLVSFLVLTLAFFSRYGGPTTANLRRHSWIMLTFIAANCLGYFATTAHIWKLAEPAFPIVSFLVQSLWILALTRTGEEAPRIQATPQEIARFEGAEEFNRQLLAFQGSLKLTHRGIERRP